jgi:hypothetical protein
LIKERQKEKMESEKFREMNVIARLYYPPPPEGAGGRPDEEARDKRKNRRPGLRRFTFHV